MKRIVTGHRNGKSVILDEREIVTVEGFQGKLAMLWQPEQIIPTIPVDENESKKELPTKFPEPGQVFLGYSWVLPDEEVHRIAEGKGIERISHQMN